MNILRKIGKWCWYKKERMILVFMLVFLGYRIYTVINVAESDTSMTFTPPSANPENVVSYGEPPRFQKQYDNADLAPIIRRPIFIYESPGRNNADDNVSAEDQRLVVHRIMESTDGSFKAQISTGGKKTLLAEGESFESYQLVSIDVDAQACVIFSENSAQEIIVKVKK